MYFAGKPRLGHQRFGRRPVKVSTVQAWVTSWVAARRGSSRSWVASKNGPHRLCVGRGGRDGEVILCDALPTPYSRTIPFWRNVKTYRARPDFSADWGVNKVKPSSSSARGANVVDVAQGQGVVHANGAALILVAAGVAAWSSSRQARARDHAIDLRNGISDLTNLNDVNAKNNGRTRVAPRDCVVVRHVFVTLTDTARQFVECVRVLVGMGNPFRGLARVHQSVIDAQLVAPHY